MIIHDVIQGTREWAELRAGIPTASQFDNILTRAGKRSESWERYKLTLLAERLMGHPCHEHISQWMARGKQAEQEAVEYYEFQRDLTTIPVGFVTNDDETRGASPDRFAGTIGMLEIKVPSEWVHMGYLLGSGKAYDKYMVQVQGQLLVVTNRFWTDVVSYHPEMPSAIIRIERNESFLKLLDEAVSEFSAQLDTAWLQILDDGWATNPGRKPKTSAQDNLIKALRDSLIAI